VSAPPRWRTAPPRWRTAPECAFCGHRFVNVRGSADSRSRDHIIPQSWGGPNVEWNYRAAHVRCNGRRGVRMVEGDIQDLARNLFWVLPADYTEQDRIAIARQIVEAFRVWNGLRRRKKVAIEEIPDIVRQIRKGRFPWGTV